MNHTALHPPLAQMIQKSRIPNALLLHCESTHHLTQQAIQICESINQIQIPPIDSDDPIIEPTEDILFLGVKNSVKIDHIKQLQRRIQYGTINHPRLISIINTSHKITASAINALLKIIEEPHPTCLFIFIAKTKHHIPSTIVSRCQTYFIKESPDTHAHNTQRMIDELEAHTPYVSALTFLAYPINKKIQYIHSLPPQTTVFSLILPLWIHELNSEKDTLSPPTLLFLEKIIEILNGLKYNLNLKLQLMAAMLQSEEDDINGTPR